MASTVDVAPPGSTPRGFEKSGLTYTSCYCEENIYCMVRDHIDPLDRMLYTVVFISNEDKCCPLFYQKAGKHPKIPVCWDYHVILIHKPVTEIPSSTVYDFDTVLGPFGLPFESYVSKTLYGDESFWSEPDPEIDREAMISFVGSHPRFFRLVAAEEYIRLFSSSRKHMMKEPSARRGESLDVVGVEGWEDEWLAKPPDYPPVRTKDSDDSLEMFLDFSRLGEDGYGVILDEQAFWREFTGADPDGAGLPTVIPNEGKPFT